MALPAWAAQMGLSLVGAGVNRFFANRNEPKIESNRSEIRAMRDEEIRRLQQRSGRVVQDIRDNQDPGSGAFSTARAIQDANTQTQNAAVDIGMDYIDNLLSDKERVDMMKYNRKLNRQQMTARGIQSFVNAGITAIGDHKRNKILENAIAPKVVGDPAEDAADEIDIQGGDPVNLEAFTDPISEERKRIYSILLGGPIIT